MIDNVLALEIENILKQANINVNKKNFEKVKDFVVNNYDVEELTKEVYETKGNEARPAHLPTKKQYQTYESISRTFKFTWIRKDKLFMNLKGSSIQFNKEKSSATSQTYPRFPPNPPPNPKKHSNLPPPPRPPQPPELVCI